MSESRSISQIDYKASWYALRAEMEWCAYTGHGTFHTGASREDSARAVLARMAQIEDTVSFPSTVAFPFPGPWAVVDTWPSPLLYWSPIIGWCGLPDQAGIFPHYSGALTVAEDQKGVAVPLDLIGAEA